MSWVWEKTSKTPHVNIWLRVKWTDFLTQIKFLNLVNLKAN